MMFGEGRFVCDGEFSRRCDNKAGGPHCCALLEQPASVKRYEDWDAPDARFDLMSPRSTPYSMRRTTGINIPSVMGIDEVSSLVSGLSISPSTSVATAQGAASSERKLV